ncbi:MAG: peptidoglycan-binding domain-containing protein [Methylocystis sp.]
MREALAVSPNDFSSRGERSANSKRSGKSGKAKQQPLWRRVTGASGSLRSMLFLGFAGVVCVGVPVNALFMQEGRRPAPTIALNTATDAARQSQTAAPRARPAPAALAKPEAQKMETPKVEAAKPAEGMSDSIARLLGGDAAPKAGSGATSAAKSEVKTAVKTDPKGKSVIFAQRALAKLGYSLHQDGVYGGTTRQAIEKFERSSGMPVKGELSPKIIRLLASRSGVAFK